MRYAEFYMSAVSAFSSEFTFKIYKVQPLVADEYHRYIETLFIKTSLKCLVSFGSVAVEMQENVKMCIMLSLNFKRDAGFRQVSVISEGSQVTGAMACE